MSDISICYLHRVLTQIFSFPKKGRLIFVHAICSLIKPPSIGIVKRGGKVKKSRLG